MFFFLKKWIFIRINTLILKKVVKLKVWFCFITQYNTSSRKTKRLSFILASCTTIQNLITQILKTSIMFKNIFY